MSKQCCICGNDAGTITSFRRSFKGTSFVICSSCNGLLLDLDKPKQREAAQYKLQELYQSGKTTPGAVLMVKNYLRETPTAEEIEAARPEFSPVQNLGAPEGLAPAVSNSSLIVAGCVFLALAILFYFLSTYNGLGVVNIQGTVFCGANFVAAVVCFVGAKIVKAVNSR